MPQVRASISFAEAYPLTIRPGQVVSRFSPGPLGDYWELRAKRRIERRMRWVAAMCRPVPMTIAR
jgi:hypothetical protein